MRYLVGQKADGSQENYSPLNSTRVVAKMPKMKTHKGTKKRFRLTATGKVKHRSAGTSHLASRMSHKRKRNLRGTTTVDSVECAKIALVLGKHSY
jgi:large subunit ribosomal protein L35